MDISRWLFFWIFGLLGGFTLGVNQVSNLIEVDQRDVLYHIDKVEEVKDYKLSATFTAYNSVEGQTDSSPCIGSGGNICEISRYQRVCATRLYKLGTIIDIEGFGPCVVLDRTAKKYGNRIDIFMGKDIIAAKNFGIKRLRYNLVK